MCAASACATVLRRLLPRPSLPSMTRDSAKIKNLYHPCSFSRNQSSPWSQAASHPGDITRGFHFYWSQGSRNEPRTPAAPRSGRVNPGSDYQHQANSRQYCASDPSCCLVLGGGGDGSKSRVQLFQCFASKLFECNICAKLSIPVSGYQPQNRRLYGGSGNII